MATTSSPSRPGRLAGTGSPCWAPGCSSSSSSRKASRRRHRWSATSATVVRSRVGQPPRRSTRASRSRSWSRASQLAAAEVGAGEPAQRVRREQPAVGGVLDPVLDQGDALDVLLDRRSSGRPEAGRRRDEAGDDDVRGPAPVGEVPRVAQLRRVVLGRRREPLDHHRPVAEDRPPDADRRRAGAAAAAAMPAGSGCHMAQSSQHRDPVDPAELQASARVAQALRPRPGRPARRRRPARGRRRFGSGTASQGSTTVRCRPAAGRRAPRRPRRGRHRSRRARRRPAPRIRAAWSAAAS